MRRKLSSIGNYLNRLYDYRKLPSLLRGFRCITVLVAALRKGSCKCKVDYTRPILILSTLFRVHLLVDQLAIAYVAHRKNHEIDNRYIDIRHLFIYHYIDKNYEFHQVFENNNSL